MRKTFIPNKLIEILVFYLAGCVDLWMLGLPVLLSSCFLTLVHVFDYFALFAIRSRSPTRFLLSKDVYAYRYLEFTL